MKDHPGQYLTLNRQPGVYSQGQAVSMINVRRGIADQMNDVKFQADGMSAMTYLVAGGIAESRLSAAGKGETEPVADNDSPEGRAQNRRVVIKRKAYP